MKEISGFNDEMNILSGVGVAVGLFDGVHKGHRALIKRLVAESGARGIPAVVYTFSEADNPKPNKGRLSSDEQKRDILLSLGVKEVINVPFGEVKDISARDFINGVLYEKLGARVVVCGYDFHFGRGGTGDFALIDKELSPKGVKTVSFDPVTDSGVTVSSTYIRELIKKGDIGLANRLLEREFSFESPVLYGAKLGRKLGFPTANQLYPSRLTEMRYGVYFTEVEIEGKIYRGVTNVGIKPTVDAKEVSAETHILDLEDDIYGKMMKVRFLKFLRDEKKFDSIDSLKWQVLNDIISAKEFFADKYGE